MGEIRLGTSGFSFQSWKGPIYPTNIKDSEMFEYYANQLRFNTVEINYTYYRQPVARGMEALARRSPANFDFTIKLFGGITHEPWKIFPPTKIDHDLCRQFLEGIRPVREAGKLGCLLAQFPGSLLRSPEAWGYLLSLPEALDHLPLVYEFRNKGWISKETNALLAQAGIGFCAVDEPQLGALMPLVPVVTSPIGYLRLHGRSKKWFKDPKFRYDYLYSEEELQEFVPIVQSMREKCKVLYVAFNNCHVGSATRNAKQMQRLLDIEMFSVQGSFLD